MTDNQTPILELLASMQSGGVVSKDHATEAILLLEEDLPWVDLPDGSQLQLLHVDINQNLWVVRNRFKPGFCIDTHYHTGPVFAVTQSGEWFYKEYPDKINKAGSYLFEPAHSLHTLTVAEDAKEDAVAWFAVFGSNVNVDENGDVTSMVDARTILKVYRALCELKGESCDNVIVIGE
ncbi:2,4'-dihydroxyacetophenone dioxygenase family protein [Maricurvus nonylphenolicus]|uniref:2,4'-dihydroxyacetophenone dioxygenase family protein n=1 Tax=Maricurvus nonylphenolicus TaxID=1008307 RepID=UPI0036F33D56